MKIIEPVKGINKKLIVHGMYENQFIIFSVSLAAFVLIFLTSLGDFFSGKEDSMSLEIFSIITILLLAVLCVEYILFTRQAKKGEKKQYPKGHIRIINKEF